MIAVGTDGFAVLWFDHDGTVQSGLLLHARVRVIPKGPALFDLEAVGEGLAGQDASKTDTRHAVHLEWQDHAVPVDGGGFSQTIGDAYRDRIAFTPAQRGCWNGAIDCGCHSRLAREIHGQFSDLQRKLRASQLGGAGRGTPLTEQLGRLQPWGSTGENAACGEPLHEAATRRKSRL